MLFREHLPPIKFQNITPALFQVGVGGFWGLLTEEGSEGQQTDELKIIVLWGAQRYKCDRKCKSNRFLCNRKPFGVEMLVEAALEKSI